MGNQPQASSRKRLGERFLTWGKFALLAGILIAVGLFSAVVGMKIALHRAEIETPDLQAKTVSDAEGILAGINLELSVVSRRYDPQIPEGAILSQSPSAGGQVKEGRKVRVIVSLGARKHPVPDLIGETLRSARAKLVSTDYRLGRVSEVKVPGAEDGEVVLQHPAPGSEESGGLSIDLLVSRPLPSDFVMPDVVGSSLSRVFRIFETAGFKIGDIRYRPRSGKRRGTVLRQYPEPGNRLREDVRINVEVAS